MSNLVQFQTTGLIGDDFNGATDTSSLLPEFNIMIEDPDAWKEYYRRVMGDAVDKYNNLQQLEADPNNIYYKFTEAVKRDPHAYKKYLGDLYKATYKKGITNATNTKWDTYGTYNENDGTYTVADDQISNFRTWYNTARTDGKFGYFHLTPPILEDSNNLSDNTSNENLNIGEKNPPSENLGINGENEEGKKDTLSLKIENPYQVIPLLENLEERKDIKPWLTPIIAGHTNDWLTARKVAAEKKKGISIPKEIAPYKQAIVTNDYFTRSQMEKRAKELEQLAAESGIVDEKAKAQHRASYLQQARDIRDKALALKQETFNRTSKEANDVANWNRAVATEVANKNNAKIAAAKQLLANINAQEAATKGTIQSKFITDAANEIRQAEYINKLDKKTREKQNSINDLQLQIDSLIDKYKSINNQSLWDNTKFVESLNFLADNDDKYHIRLIGKETNEDIKNYWESIKESDSNVKNVFDTFEKKKQNLLDDIVKQISNLRRKQNIKAQETTYVSNTPEIVENTYNLFKKRHKTGGNITKAQIQAAQSKFNAIQRSQDRFHERLYKQQKDANKNTTERLKIAQMNLDKALGRLSQEDMLLLKKLFL